MYQGASTAPELRQVSMQSPVATPRKAVSMELQGRGREDGETTSDDEETYSETANRGGGSTFEEDTQGKEYSTSEDEEEEDQWNERMEEDAEEGVKRIGRLPENLLQP